MTNENERKLDRGNFLDVPHYLICGDDKGFLDDISQGAVRKWVFSGNPKKLRLLLASASKDSWLYELKDRKVVLAPFISRPVLLLNAFSSIRREMERRMNLFIKERVVNIEQYNAKFQDGSNTQRRKQLPYIFLVIDGVEKFEATLGNAFLHNVKSITNIARFMGVHFIFSEMIEKGQELNALSKHVISCFPKEGVFDLRIDENLYKKALIEALQEGKVSKPLLQELLSIDYEMAGVIFARMLYEGVLGRKDEQGMREILKEKANQIIQTYKKREENE